MQNHSLSRELAFSPSAVDILYSYSGELKEKRLNSNPGWRMFSRIFHSFYISNSNLSIEFTFDEINSLFSFSLHALSNSKNNRYFACLATVCVEIIFNRTLLHFIFRRESKSDWNEGCDSFLRYRSLIFSLSLSYIMFPIIFVLLIIVSAVLPKSVVIQVHGDCQTLGDRVAQEHGYRYVRQVGWWTYGEDGSVHSIRICLDFRWILWTWTRSVLS